jgi:Flp pilus assembly protein TadG
MSIRRDERGQSIVYVVVFMTVLLGMAAAVLDVGFWYREHRSAQATADAAALGGAQALPDNPGQAQGQAIDYADKNGGGLPPQNVTFSSTNYTNDTINVLVHRTAPGFFAKIFGIDSVAVNAKASARAFIPGETKYLAPITVRITHPMLNDCGGKPCFGASYPTTLPLDKTGAPGGFALINLNDDITGSVGASTLAGWIDNGYDDYLPLRQYYSGPGAKWNNSSIQDALNRRIGTELLFPVFDDLVSGGSNAEYRVIAWVGFHLTDKTVTGGDSGSISGYFTRVIWKGLPASNPSSMVDLGVRSIVLTD